MRKLKSIYVFGGSNLRKNSDFVRVANELGKVLADKGINLVYGGGIQGLRGCIATTKSFRGSKVLSVTVKDLIDKNNPYSTIGTKLKVLSLLEHFGHMFRNALFT